MVPPKFSRSDRHADAALPASLILPEDENRYKYLPWKDLTKAGTPRQYEGRIGERFAGLTMVVVSFSRKQHPTETNQERVNGIPV